LNIIEPGELRLAQLAGRNLDLRVMAHLDIRRHELLNSLFNEGACGAGFSQAEACGRLRSGGPEQMERRARLPASL
jgi:hypothetical protein